MVADISIHTPRPRKLRANFVEVVLWIALAVLTVILPNAFKEIAIILLVVISAYYALLKQIILSALLAKIWSAVAIVTLIYVFIGVMNGAPSEAVIQVIIIYIASPLLWVVALRGALATFGLPRIVRFLAVFTALAIFSQVFYYWAYLTGRFLGVLDLMAGQANLDYSDNQVAAVMFVFGSMIFLYGGLFTSPEVVGKTWVRLLFMLAALVSALTSGRSALVASIFIGVALSLTLAFRGVRRVKRSLLINALALSLSVLIGCYALWELYSIDVIRPINEVWDKIKSGGGAGRQSYLPLLLEGAADYFFLGAGHGVGVQYTVSERFPWRYEIVGAANLFRVGLVGLIIYALPFFIALRTAYRAHRKRELDVYEKYMVGALIAGIFATNTNPYIESVILQWMFVLPCTYFVDRTFLRSISHSRPTSLLEREAT